MTSPAVSAPPRYRSASMRVGCYRCGVTAGKQCLTLSGRPAQREHAEREAAYRSALRNQHSLLRLLHDDPSNGLVAGDLLIGILYWLDPAKWTILRRQSDGFDPQCNQYAQDVEWLDWAPPSEPNPAAAGAR